MSKSPVGPVREAVAEETISLTRYEDYLSMISITTDLFQQDAVHIRFLFIPIADVQVVGAPGEVSYIY